MQNFFVAAEIDESECIVGRDLIKRIPNLNSDLDAMQGTMQYMRIQVEQMQKLRDNATQKHTKLRYQTVQGDLFTADEKCSLAHCVGADSAIGAAIAKEFKTRFNSVFQLINQVSKTGCPFLQKAKIL